MTALLKQNKARKESALFVVEGSRIVSETPPEMIKELYVSESFLEKKESKELIDRFKDTAECESVTDAVFAKMSDTVHPQGILAVVKQPEYDASSLIKQGGFYLVLENIQDPGNLGTMIRTAEAAGVTAVILTQGCVDLFSPKVVRSTMGSVFRVPVCVFETTLEAAEYFKKNDIKVYAACLEGSMPYTQADYSGGTAVLIGNEGSGLLSSTIALSDGRIRIPMEGKIESLNASVSAAIIMYEAVKSRVFR